MDDTIVRDIPAFFNVMEMAAFLGISRTTAYALVKTPGFPCGRIGARIVINRTLFMEWVSKNFKNQYISLMNHKKSKGEDQLGA